MHSPLILNNRFHDTRKGNCCDKQTLIVPLVSFVYYNMERKKVQEKEESE